VYKTIGGLIVAIRKVEETPPQVPLSGLGGFRCATDVYDALKALGVRAHIQRSRRKVIEVSGEVRDVYDGFCSSEMDRLLSENKHLIGKLKKAKALAH